MWGFLNTPLRTVAPVQVRELLASPETTGKVALEAVQLVADLDGLAKCKASLGGADVEQVGPPMHRVVFCAVWHHHFCCWSEFYCSVAGLDGRSPHAWCFLRRVASIISLLLECFWVFFL